jgi:glycerate-2-kinase
VLGDKVKRRGNILSIAGKKFDLDKFKRVFVVGAGKVSFEAGVFLEEILGDRINGGAVIDVKGGRLKKIKSFVGDHPYPSERNIRATKEVVGILEKAKKDDLVIVIVSGGGSTLLSTPQRMSGHVLRDLTQELLREEADIREINIARKHIPGVHGGDLAKIAYPATVVGLIFSDVPFSDLSIVASGPTFFDRTTNADAVKVLKKYNLPPVKFSETPKDRKYFKKVSNILIVDNKTALRAMAKEAKKFGFRASIIDNHLRGEAKLVGRRLICLAKGKKAVFLFGGETMVKVSGKGKGGRNQELVLGAVEFLKPGQLIVSVASDGKDNILEAAGALADAKTKQRAKKLGLDPRQFLVANDSYHFFKKTGDVIITGMTGSNISDLMMVINE